jgi:pentatricopeptide repeat protein
MIKAYSHTEQLDKALNIYSLMTKQGETAAPSIITFNSLIDGCVRCNDMATAT